MGRGDTTPKIYDATLTQKKNIKTIDGNIIKAGKEAFTSTVNICLIADDFRQLEYTDEQTGITMGYNLFVPKDYDPAKSYPMVVFMTDATGAGKAVKNAVQQGNGATCWASPQDQAKHPCFVLAPAFNVITVDDSFTVTDDVEAAMNLIAEIMEEYSIDPSKVFLTGQSMGAMTSYVMMTRRPSMFAGAYIVAGQWNIDEMSALSDMNIWAVSCTGDDKSTAGNDKAFALWKENGAAVSEATWPLQADVEDRAASASAQYKEGCHLYYTHLEGGSHNFTWSVAYDIPAIRDWLLSTEKK